MNIFVGCSASNDIPRIYNEKSSELLNKLFSMDYNLVLGACNSGIMKIAHDTAISHNKKVIGVVPKRYEHDFKELKCNKEIVVENIIQRTSKAFDESDILLFLPGGIGSVYELFSAIETKRCHEHKKEIIIYNVNGLYDQLLEFLDRIYEEKFARVDAKKLYFVSNDESKIIEYIKNI